MLRKFGSDIGHGVLGGVAERSTRTPFDLGQLGWSQFIVNIVGLVIGFLLVALAVFLIDRILPEKSLLRSQ